ncbi:MAG TPA: ATP-binding protein [Terriglobales bacterium]|nr:ATP-binding protein [Terriglobales bacterium]
MATIDRTELVKVPAFQGLPDDQLDWFISQSEEVRLKAGEIYVREGDSADWMYVILEGEIQARGEIQGRMVVFSAGAKQVTGRLPFSRLTRYSLTGRAVADAHMLRFPASRFPELMQRMPELTQRLVSVMSDRIRETTRMEEQRDKLAALGKLSAGLAHELNNPASAARRAASQLRDALKRIRDASHELGSRDLNPTQKRRIESLELELTRRDGTPPDAMKASDLEEELDASFRSHGLNDLWQLAADLGHKGISTQAVEPLFQEFEAQTARAALVRIAASMEIANLLDQMESSTARISDLVKAIKEYTYMDQAPVQNVDIVKSLETTLTILNHRLKKGVTIHRDYAPEPLLVDSFGSELNQVWTNLIDNAIDAMNGQGELRVSTCLEDGWAVIEIADNGPGIPAEIQSRIFEPFFTTKGVGQGTGLGLDTVQRIIRRHNGIVTARSVPGNTRFQVRLPLSKSTA